MHRHIPLTRGKWALVDAEDYERVSAFNWQLAIRHGRCYATRGLKVNGKWTSQYMHRLILGITQPSIQVDHLNHDGLDNRKQNLRACTNQENQTNSRKRRPHGRASSQFKGVCWDKTLGKWKAEIKRDYKHRHIGYFLDEKEAARAYDAAAKQYHGTFAYLNFPEDAESARQSSARRNRSQ